MRKNGLQAKGFGLVKEFFHNLPSDTSGLQRFNYARGADFRDFLVVGVRLVAPSSFLSRDRTKRVRQAVPLQSGSAP